MNTSESVRIERVKLKDLQALAASAVDGAAPGTFIPITKHRALAMTHNPFAEPDDVAMLLAKQGDRNIGYFGVMPIMLQHAGTLHKVHWLTTWAVAPEFLGKGLGSQLMEAALALDVDLAIVGSKPARRVSAKYGFQELEPLKYVQIDLSLARKYNPITLFLRLARKILTFFDLRIRIEPLSQPFERLFEFVFGPLVRGLLLLLLARSGRRKLHKVQLERATPEVKPALQEIPDKKKTGFYRDSRIVNWMITYPWVLSQSESEDLSYAFSDTREFEIFAWNLFDASGKSLGYIAFQLTRLRGRRVLKVLDHDLIDQSPEMLLALAVQTARQGRASLIEGPAELAIPLANSLLGQLLVVRQHRTCQVHPRSEDSPMAKAWPSIEQTYVDGDMAFT